MANFRSQWGSGLLANNTPLNQPQMQGHFELEVLPKSDVPPNSYSWEGDISLHVDTSALPTFTFEEVEAMSINGRSYFAGAATFEAMSITSKDLIDGKTARGWLEWSKLVYNVKTGRLGLAKDYKRECHVFQYAPNGWHHRQWIFQGVWPQTITFGTLDLSATTTINMIEVTLRYDKAFPEAYDELGSFVSTGAGSLDEAIGTSLPD